MLPKVYFVVFEIYAFYELDKPVPLAVRSKA
jgi:hypothetical protein